MRGRPFKKGESGNPGGRPKVIAELRELARAHAPDAIKELARLALTGKSANEPRDPGVEDRRFVLGRDFDLEAHES
jgi:hypothetical protein